MILTVASALLPVVHAGAATFDAVRNAAPDPAMDGPLEAAAARARGTPDERGVIASVRAMYRRLGIDPTRTRPSSEALLRRVRKGEALPRVNAAVDVCNWCSVETLLPFGLYDRDRIEGGVELRIGGDGEQYEGIRKDVVHVAGRMTLADARGPFGNPTSDSARTMVTTATVRLLVVVFVPRAMGELPADQALDLTAARLAQFTGARERERTVS
jgi:DNA/RNA-binding domain of Phe-tRNA-synthetase-like protein